MSVPSTGGTRYGVPVRRQSVVDQLGDAYSRNMLDQREFEKRVAAAQEADTIEALEALVADFGSGGREVGPRRSLVSVFSSQNHVWDPEEGESVGCRTVFGETVLDLRAWRGSGRTLTLRVSGAFLETRIRVPAGTKVIRRERMLFGEYRHKAAQAPGTLKQLWTRFVSGTEIVPASPFPVDGPAPTLVLEGTWFLGEVIVEESL